MAGRKVFFSFHYEEDVWRAANVRNSGQFDAVAAAGWNDASIWESTKRRGDDAVKKLIEAALRGTSVTCVLIGTKTASRRWVNYEIQRSIERGNGLLGVRIHNLKVQSGRASSAGAVPPLLSEGGYKIYNWDAAYLGRRVELAAINAGHPCLQHGSRDCRWCRLRLLY